jgi:hypothetical protein
MSVAGVGDVSVRGRAGWRDGPAREQRFASLYASTYADVLRFVQRRAGPDHAEDAVHEAFLVAWRRLDVVPGRPTTPALGCSARPATVC